MNRRRKHSSGYVTIQMIGITLVTLMISAFAIDFGFYHAAQNVLESAAQAGALAGTKQLFTSTSGSSSLRQSEARTEAANIIENNYELGDAALDVDSGTDLMLGYIDPNTRQYNPDTFQPPSASTDYSQSGGYNAMRVTVRRTAESPGGSLPSIMGNLFEIGSMDTSATAIAMIDGNIQSVSGGLRPFYACLAQYNAANADGNPENDTAKIYGSLQLNGSDVAGCPAYTSGNWGMADLRDGESGAPGQNTFRRWIEHGFNYNDGNPGDRPGEGPVYVDHTYSTQPGNSISSYDQILDTLISEGTVITVPLIDTMTGSGSNSQAHVAGFAGFVITGYKSNGSSASRYIEGYFTKSVCNEQCTTGGSTFGGGMVKLRLAG